MLVHGAFKLCSDLGDDGPAFHVGVAWFRTPIRSEEHTSELQSHRDLHSFPTRRSSDLPRVNVWSRLPSSFAARAVTIDESMPPLRKQPTGTSEIKCSCTARSSCVRISETMDPRSTSVWRGSGRQ